MKTNDRVFFTPRLIMGLSVIALGILFLLNNLEIVSARPILSYWPALLIVFGAAHFFQHRTPAGTTWSLILVFIGTGMLLDRIYQIEFNIWSYWPLLLVFFGASMIFQGFGRHHIELDSENIDSDSTINTTAVLGGVKRNVCSKDFRGGELTAVMGGIDLDLRQAEIKDEAVIEVVAVMGGVEIKVPEEWHVIMQGTPVLGGFVNNANTPKEENAKRLILKGTAVMGGVEVRNTDESSWNDRHHYERERRRHDDIR
jgi:predicted membrane protein